MPNTLERGGKVVVGGGGGQFEKSNGQRLNSYTHTVHVITLDTVLRKHMA